MSATMCLDASPAKLTPRAYIATMPSNLPSSIRPASASTDINSLIEDAKRYAETGGSLNFLAMTVTKKVETAVPRLAKSKTNTNAIT
jgi:hypothetical protein